MGVATGKGGVCSPALIWPALLVIRPAGHPAPPALIPPMPCLAPAGAAAAVAEGTSLPPTQALLLHQRTPPSMPGMRRAHEKGPTGSLPGRELPPWLPGPHAPGPIPRSAAERGREPRGGARVAGAGGLFGSTRPTEATGDYFLSATVASGPQPPAPSPQHPDCSQAAGTCKRQQ